MPKHIALRMGRMNDLKSRDALWRLLSRMTRNKVIDVIRYNTRRHEYNQQGGDSDSSDDDWALAQACDDQIPPAVVAEVQDEMEKLLNRLPNEREKSTALRRLSGYTVREIAEERKCNITTIERELRMIRGRWQSMSDMEPINRKDER